MGADGAGDGRVDSLWRFALALYARPGIAALCLDLQDRYRIDVPVLLWAAWNGVMLGRALSLTDLAAAEDAVGPWRRDVVAPLRAVRRRLKHGPAPLAPAAASDALRDRIKALELEAERLQLAELARHPVGPAPEEVTADALATNLGLLIPGPAGAAVTHWLHAAALSAQSSVLASNL